MKKTLFSLALLAALMLCSCENPFEPAEKPDNQHTDVSERLAKAQPLHLTASSAEQEYAKMGTGFANDLFSLVCKEAKKNENVSLSPLSLQIALGMLANGVEPDAQKELLAVVAGKDTSIDDMNAWYHKVRDAFEETMNVVLANAMWAQKDYPIKDKFFRVNGTYYDAVVGNLDFINQTAQAHDSICRWADVHTFGCIKDLNLPLTEDTRLVLANATWFGANWAQPFAEGLTTKETVTSSAGKKQTVNMMEQTEYFPYAEAEDYALLEMPFQNHSFSMLVALPKKGKTADDIVLKIDWNLSLKNTYARLRLPKFDFKTTNELKDLMPKLGIQKVFNYGALSGINPELEIDFINQDVSVSVFETGTEMAAVTTIGMAKNSAIGPDLQNPIDFNVDHAFVFCVRDNICHSTLFLGKVENIESK